jgi:hypothetical protein
MLGRNLADVVEFMKNPINQDITDQLVAKVEVNW